MTDAPELLPCPFCGGEASFEQIGNRRRSTIASCNYCGCRLENGEEWGHGTGWNTRATNQQALDAAREEGRRKGLEEAAKAVDEAGWYCIPPYEETGNLSEQIDHSLEAIRALINTPTDPVAEAARVLMNVIRGWDSGDVDDTQFRKLAVAASFGAQAFTVTPHRDAKPLAMMRAFLTAAIDDSDADLDWLRSCNMVRLAQKEGE